MRHFIINFQDIAGCPKRSLLPSHYRISAKGTRCACRVLVRIENTYSDGHESYTDVMLPLPGQDEWQGTDEAGWETWWSEVVAPNTGDGHGAQVRGLGYCHTAEIIEGDHPLVGMTREWSGR